MDGFLSASWPDSHRAESEQAIAPVCRSVGIKQNRHVAWVKVSCTPVLPVPIHQHVYKLAELLVSRNQNLTVGLYAGGKCLSRSSEVGDHLATDAERRIAEGRIERAGSLRSAFQNGRSKHGDIWIIGVQRANQFSAGIFQTAPLI